MFQIQEYLPYFTNKRARFSDVPGTLFPLCRPDPNRAILHITCQAGVEFWLWTVNSSDTSNADYARTGPYTMRFTWSNDGPIPTLAFWGVVGGATGTPGFVVNEWIWQPPAGS